MYRRKIQGLYPCIYSYLNCQCCHIKYGYNKQELTKTITDMTSRLFLKANIRSLSQMNLYLRLKQVDLSLGKWIDGKDKISQLIILNTMRILLFTVCIYIIGFVDFNFYHIAENIISNIYRIDIYIVHGIMIMPLLAISAFFMFSVSFIFYYLLKRCFMLCYPKK